MLWQEHSGFSSEFKKVGKKNKALSEGFSAAKKLLAVQFDPRQPQPIISPGKIHQLHAEENWSLWKLEVVTRGLRPNQFPRIWFVVRGETITFLAIASHTQNYDDNEYTQRARERYEEIA